MAGPDERKRLQEEVARRGEAAFLLTTSEDGRPHAVVTVVRWPDDHITAPTGGRTQRNVAARPLVSFLWPPSEPGGYSLVVDAEAVLDGDVVHARPTRGVLHRLGEGMADGAPYSSDCVRILNP